MSCKHFTNEDYNASFSKEYLREEYLNYPPLWVTLGIISACNYCCEFCSYHSPDARHISKVFNVRYTMPKEEAFKIIDFLHQGGVPRIHICATGEPLLHPDFFSILDYTIERYGSVSFSPTSRADFWKKRMPCKKSEAGSTKSALLQPT